MLYWISKKWDENLIENIFKFYENIMNVNYPRVTILEYHFLLQEIKLFEEVLKNSNLEKYFRWRKKWN